MHFIYSIQTNWKIFEINRKQNNKKLGKKEGGLKNIPVPKYPPPTTQKKKTLKKITGVNFFFFFCYLVDKLGLNKHHIR